MNIFIDTNIYLNFYSLSNEDLEELSKIIVLQKNERVKIWLPEQARDEFNRNRDGKISEALRMFKDEKLNNQIPQIAKNYDEYKDLMKAVDLFRKKKNEIISKLMDDIYKKELKADILINSIFNNADLIEVSEHIYAKAKTRFDRGNPPGKKSSYGDAINWELLLDTIPDNENIHIVTEDTDYYSKINEDEVNDFMRNEWCNRKNSQIFVYKRLSKLMANHFPQVKLAVELEKELAIERLLHSGSYRETHMAISILAKHAEFTNLQINQIIEAYINNSQVYWIIKDEDVSELVNMILTKYSQVIDSENLSCLLDFLAEVNTEDNNEDFEADIPF